MYAASFPCGGIFALSLTHRDHGKPGGGPSFETSEFGTYTSEIRRVFTSLGILRDEEAPGAPPAGAVGVG